jgi:hypothetical protein
MLRCARHFRSWLFSFLQAYEFVKYLREYSDISDYNHFKILHIHKPEVSDMELPTNICLMRVYFGTLYTDNCIYEHLDSVA